MADSRIDELRRRLERDPGSRLFAQLAEEYRKAGNHADAIRVARTGLAQHPSYPSARLTLGRALLESGDPAGARVELEAALKEAPDNILASRFLGQALEVLGELAPALVQLEKTLKLAPGDRQLERQIVSLQAKLRSPQPPAPTSPADPSPALLSPPSSPPRPTAPHRPGPQPPAATPAIEVPEASPSSWEVTARMPGAEGAGAAGAEPLPPTIRIRPPGSSGAWARNVAVPPPLPASATPTAATPAGPPPLPPPAPTPAVTERLPPSASAVYESDVAPTLPPAQGPTFDETTVPTLPPGALAAEETVFEPEPPVEVEPEPPTLVPKAREARPTGEARLVPQLLPPLEDVATPERPPAGGPGAATTTPFSSSTLAELYLKQGLVERAVEVYRQLLVEEPGNERARARLAEIERMPSGDAARAARRRELERTIAGLEALLAVVQRR